MLLFLAGINIIGSGAGPLIMKDHYKVLGISGEATPEEIKRAYLGHVKKWHPDRNPHDPLSHEMMKMYNIAFDVLSDPNMRLAYDRAMGYGSQPEPERSAEAGAEQSYKTSSAPDMGFSMPDEMMFNRDEPLLAMTRGRTFSLIFSAVVFLLVVIFLHNEEDVVMTLFTLFGGLIFIWFGDEIGEYSVYGLYWYSANVTPTPGWMLRIFGWIFLFVPLLLFFR
jgi:hypothetical protein